MTEAHKRDIWIAVVAGLVIIILILLLRKHQSGGIMQIPNFTQGPQWTGGPPLSFAGLPNFSPPALPKYNLLSGAPGFNTQPCACGTNTVS